CLRPIVWMVLKFRDLPTRIHLFIAQTFEGILQGAGHTRDHGVLGQTRFQHLQYGPVAEAGIGPHSKLPNVGRGGVKTKGQEFLAARQVPASPRRSSTSQRNEEFASKQSSGS